MSNWPNLSRAPIVEGLIDIRVELPPPPNLAALKNLSDELAEDFPSRNERFRWSGSFSIDQQLRETRTTQYEEPDGYVLRSVDGGVVAQFRFDGLTLSRLQPYGSWDDLTKRTKFFWNKYRDAVRPVKVPRVACRFINRIPFPAGSSFETIFATGFSLPSSLPQNVAGFLLRIALPFNPEQSMAIVSQTLDSDGAHCILDIDVFSERAEGFTEPEIWEKLAGLREIKNRLFFESLTPSTLERFK